MRFLVIYGSCDQNVNIATIFLPSVWAYRQIAASSTQDRKGYLLKLPIISTKSLGSSCRAGDTVNFALAKPRQSVPIGFIRLKISSASSRGIRELMSAAAKSLCMNKL